MGKEHKKPFWKQRKNQVWLILLVALVLAIVVFNQGNSQSAQVAYLYPFNGAIPNIWIAPLDKPTEAEQVTFTKMGIHGFDVSRNGRLIAYTMRDETTRVRNIFLLDMQTGETRQLTNCAELEAECYSPVFHPNSSVIAYVRLSTIDDDLHGTHSNVENIWLLDIATGENRSLTNDIHFIGKSPQWSDDGNTLAFYNADLADPKIIVYNFSPADSSPRTQYAANSYNGLVGSLAPNRLELIYPDFINRDGQAFSYLSLANFEEVPPSFSNLTEPQDPIDDIAAEWHPDGKTVTIARRYTDSRWTQGYQIYDLDLTTKEITPLIVDENYSHHYFDWDTDGEYLLMQRVPVSGTLNAVSKPEVWVLDTTSDKLILIAEEAYHPRWVNAK